MAKPAKKSRLREAPARARDGGSEATRIAGAELGAVESDENFPGCKALKSHEMEKESVDWSLPFAFGGRVTYREQPQPAEAGSEAHPAHQSRWRV
jgi:hypothetical protein